MILSNGNADVETWYHLWEATVALNAMCVRAGKRGTATRLGERPHFHSEIGGRESGRTPLIEFSRHAWEPLHGNLRPTVPIVGRSCQQYSCRAGLGSRYSRRHSLCELKRTSATLSSHCTLQTLHLVTASTNRKCQFPLR